MKLTGDKHEQCLACHTYSILSKFYKFVLFFYVIPMHTQAGTDFPLNIGHPTCVLFILPDEFGHASKNPIGLHP
jgi:hypothetical protein